MVRDFLPFALMLTLLVSVLAPLSVQTQPPVVMNTLYVGYFYFWPFSADPASAFDTCSGELIANVYDTLITTNGEVYWQFTPLLATNVPEREEITKLVASTDIDLSSPTGSTWSDGSHCVGWIDSNNTDFLDAGDTVYAVENDGSYRTWFVQTLNPSSSVTAVLWRGCYTFNMQTSPEIDFVNETGNIVDTFDVYDAEYSFKRGLVQDQLGSAMYTFYKPLFDQYTSDLFASNATEPTVMSLAHLIDDAIEISGDNLTINVGLPIPDGAFKQLLSQPWESIVSKEFSISIGCWNGDLYADSDADGYPDWWTVNRRVDPSSYDAVTPFRYCGTGPYRVVMMDSVNHAVRLNRNANYWRGWPAQGAKSFVETIEIGSYSGYLVPTFEDCTLDIANVPKTYYIPLDQGDPAGLSAMKKIRNLYELSLDAVFFTFTIDPMSSYVGSGQFPNGIPLDFFNNTHVRKAFAHAFNRTEYARAVSLDARFRETPLICGLAPDYYTKLPDPPWTYDTSLDAAESELKQALFNGTSVWDSGFTLDFPYHLGSSAGQMLSEMARSFFAELSAHGGRTGPPLQVNPVAAPSLSMRKCPLWSFGWVGESSDADSYIRPFMHGQDFFAFIQNYTVSNGWGKHKDELIDTAARTPDGAVRATMYAELEQIYINDCPSLPVAQFAVREWLKYWVRGWYYNPAMPQRYYSIWKEITCWYDIAGAQPTPLYPGISDGKTTVKDISYLIFRFNSKPPTPDRVDPLWIGTYGCGGVDPSCDRSCSVKDITGAVLHFAHMSEP